MTNTWKNHNSGECPVARNVWVDVMRANGEVDYALPARGWNWSRGIEAYGEDITILAYRVSTMQAEDYRLFMGEVA